MVVGPIRVSVAPWRTDSSASSWRRRSRGRPLAERARARRAVLGQGPRRGSRCAASSRRPRTDRGARRGVGAIVVDSARQSVGDILATTLRVNSYSVAELLIARSVLETEVAGLAAQNRTDDDVAELDAAMSAMRVATEVRDVKAAIVAHERFHVCLALATRNRGAGGLRRTADCAGARHRLRGDGGLLARHQRPVGARGDFPLRRRRRPRGRPLGDDGPRPHREARARASTRARATVPDRPLRFPFRPPPAQRGAP